MNVIRKSSGVSILQRLVNLSRMQRILNKSSEFSISVALARSGMKSSC